MNARAHNADSDVAEKDLRAELISRCNLTAEDVETIYSAMEPNDTFDSAALRLGFVTEEMIAYARDHSVADSLNYIATWNAAMLMSSDMQEAMMASMQKVPPKFRD